MWFGTFEVPLLFTGKWPQLKNYIFMASDSWRVHWYIIRVYSRVSPKKHSTPRIHRIHTSQFHRNSNRLTAWAFVQVNNNENHHDTLKWTKYESVFPSRLEIYYEIHFWRSLFLREHLKFANVAMEYIFCSGHHNKVVHHTCHVHRYTSSRTD